MYNSRSPSLPRFGAHLSVAGGLFQAIYAGETIGFDCVQIFVKNQKQWRAPALTGEQIEAFNTAKQKAGLHPVVAHGSYLLNLASANDEQRERSINALIDEHQRCEALGIAGLVFHPGAHVNSTINDGIAYIAQSLDRVLVESPPNACTILLECTAGQGSSIGWRFEHLADILAHVRNSHGLGVCLDTCHLFAAGYDFRTAEGYAAMIDELDCAIGLSLVKCIHVNDSKNDCGSRVDRHEHIGQGKIGAEGFAHFINDPRFAGMPMILETPKGVDDEGTDLDRVNLERLRSLIKV